MMEVGNLRIRGVVFDLDGTVIADQHDYGAIRRELGLPVGTPLLEAVEGLAARERLQARKVLRRHERAAARTATLNPGVQPFLRYLDQRGIHRGLLTRNTRASVSVVLRRCGLHFDPVVTREDGPYKPNPHGLHHICASWNLKPGEVLMVGDYLFDIEVGRNVGTRTALITHGRDWPFASLADLTFSSFEDLPETLWHWLEQLP